MLLLVVRSADTVFVFAACEDLELLGMHASLRSNAQQLLKCKRRKLNSVYIDLTVLMDWNVFSRSMRRILYTCLLGLLCYGKFRK